MTKLTGVLVGAEPPPRRHCRRRERRYRSISVSLSLFGLSLSRLLSLSPRRLAPPTTAPPSVVVGLLLLMSTTNQSMMVAGDIRENEVGVGVCRVNKPPPVAAPPVSPDGEEGGGWIERGEMRGSGNVFCFRFCVCVSICVCVEREESG
ncbi:hypothetical protein Hanom_Chr01g00035311 [Helianthus anomalus]